MSNFPEMEYKPMVVDDPERVVDQDLDALKYLQLVYRGQIQAEGQRMRAAIAALPFETPRLSINANIEGKDFGLRLEAAIKRSGVQIERVRVIEAKPPQIEPPQTDVTLRPPVPDRRFRRV
jgi:hypothetical protein